MRPKGKPASLQKSEVVNRNSAHVPDFTVENHVSIFLFRMNTPAAEAWVWNHVQSDAMFFDGALVVEHRYVQDLVLGIIVSGLTVS